MGGVSGGTGAFSGSPAITKGVHGITDSGSAAEVLGENMALLRTGAVGSGGRTAASLVLAMALI